MKHPRKEWDTRLLDNATRTAVRHRRGQAVTKSTVLTILLAFAGDASSLFKELLDNGACP